MTTYTVLTRKQARAATKAHTAYRKALRAEARAAKVDAPTPIMWRLAAACDRTLQAFWQAMQGIAAPVKRTAKNRALGGVLALATIGRVIARAAHKVAHKAARKVANAAVRVARKAARAARAALRRAVVGVLALLPLTAAATTTTTTTTEPATMLVARIAPPRTLNGHEVLAVRPRANGGHVILAWTGGFHPWVTAVWFNGTGWTWGHYFPDEDTARADFLAR